jgi:hypothetical protein
MELTEGEKLKAQRTQRWIYILMALMITLPFIILAFRSR